MLTRAHVYTVYTMYNAHRTSTLIHIYSDQPGSEHCFPNVETDLIGAHCWAVYCKATISESNGGYSDKRRL